MFLILGNQTFSQEQTKSLANWNIESRLLFSITPNTIIITKPGQFTSLYQEVHKRLNAPMLHITFGRPLIFTHNMKVIVKVGLGAFYNELSNGKSKDFSFPTVGGSIIYKHPKFPISLEFDAFKMFYNLEQSWFLEEKGGIGLGLNVGYPLPILDNRIRLKIGYQYMNKQELLNLDIFKFSSLDPDWKGIYNYTIYNNLISTALEFRF